MGDWKKINFYLFYLCAALVLVGLPTSRALISIGGIGLSAVWLLEWARQIVQDQNTFGIWRKFWQNKAAVVLSAIFLLHLVGLLWTADIDFGLRDLRIKLPLLFMPIVFSSGPELDRCNL